MSAAAPRALNCPSCGAGQSVFGGGRVHALICVQCGATLDARDGFREIAARRELRWPETPLSIGMTGRVAGVDVAVIGVLGQVERYRGRVWRWVDHQIYSPTHGYAWLTWEDGRFVFTRRTRLAPTGWRGGRIALERAETPPIVRLGDERFVYYDSGDRETEFAAGAFAFTPAVGDSVYAMSFLGRRRMATRIETSAEVEWELSELVPRRETLAAFGVEPASVGAAAPGVHPLETYEKSTPARAVRDGALGLAAFCGLLMLWFGALPSGDLIEASDWTPRGAEAEIAFTLTDASRLVGVEIETDVTNAWVEAEFELFDADDAPVGAGAREIGFYSGVSSGERWTEGSRSERALLRAPAPGDYTLFASLGEGGRWTGAGARGLTEASRFRVRITEGNTSGWPAFFVGLAALAVGLGLAAMGWIHDTRRRAGSDWSDE